MEAVEDPDSLRRKYGHRSSKLSIISEMDRAIRIGSKRGINSPSEK
jgi:hypothetical protein